MALENKHIDFDRLARYLQNEMSALERNGFEKEALSNPFLAEAIEGYENNPESFEDFEQKYKKELSGDKDYTFLIGLSILGLLFLLAYVIDFEDSKNGQAYIKEKSIHKDLYVEHVMTEVEIEHIPLAIDTLAMMNANEMIPLAELKAKQSEGIPTSEEEKPNNEDELIIIEETSITHDDYHYVSEEKYRLGQNSLETVYMHDLMVVDYRVITRNKKKISYTRLNLSGVSAANEYENESEEKWTETEVEVPYVNYLRRSMEHFADGDYKKALNRYQTILEQYNNDINAHFYGGLCLYNLGQYDKTIEHLNILLEDEYHVFDQEAAWYKANSLIRLNRKEEAKSVLKTIIAQDGFYSSQAIKLSKSL